MIDDKVISEIYREGITKDELKSLYEMGYADGKSTGMSSGLFTGLGVGFCIGLCVGIISYGSVVLIMNQ